MTAVVAPVLPYMVEEIHSILHEGDEGESHPSVFARKWTPVSAEWNDPQAEQDMGSLPKMRSVVHLKNSLEADVDIILPDEAFLKTHFIVSNANIKDEGSLGTGSFAWSYVYRYFSSCGARILWYPKSVLNDKERY
ncbi:hypothetical protein M405DRAFT_817312 [Rhizopogon salebrosus TDB-379]|nr:hypothetical protein M405DRAFT_817312 [Rhizopogon salebrosus TDB-379]